MAEDRLAGIGRLLIIAPHPDDEVLGAGGTIARLSRAGHEVFVAVVTRGRPPRFREEWVARIREEARLAHRLLGVRHTYWLDQPAAELSQVPHSVLNDAIGTVLEEVRPDTLMIPFVGDMHLDHQLIFLSALVGARPLSTLYPRTILAYETLSETHWNAPYVTPAFTPHLFVDIEATLEVKIEAMLAFASQVRPFPHERSIEALRALAMLRGANVHRAAAEAFVMIRQVL